MLQRKLGNEKCVQENFRYRGLMLVVISVGKWERSGKAGNDSGISGYVGKESHEMGSVRNEKEIKHINCRW